MYTFKGNINSKIGEEILGAREEILEMIDNISVDEIDNIIISEALRMTHPSYKNILIQICEGYSVNAVLKEATGKNYLPVEIQKNIRIARRHFLKYYDKFKYTLRFNGNNAIDAFHIMCGQMRTLESNWWHDIKIPELIFKAYSEKYQYHYCTYLLPFIAYYDGVLPSTLLPNLPGVYIYDELIKNECEYVIFNANLIKENLKFIHDYYLEYFTQDTHMIKVLDRICYSDHKPSYYIEAIEKP